MKESGDENSSPVPGLSEALLVVMGSVWSQHYNQLCHRQSTPGSGYQPPLFPSSEKETACPHVQTFIGR